MPLVDASVAGWTKVRNLSWTWANRRVNAIWGHSRVGANCIQSGCRCIPTTNQKDRLFFHCKRDPVECKHWLFHHPNNYWRKTRADHQYSDSWSITRVTIRCRCSVNAPKSSADMNAPPTAFSNSVAQKRKEPNKRGEVFYTNYAVILAFSLLLRWHKMLISVKLKTKLVHVYRM